MDDFTMRMYDQWAELMRAGYPAVGLITGMGETHIHRE
jgi:hypothetical protein